MAGGWTRDGAVQDQIDDTVKDAVLHARALTPQGESAEDCDDCGEPIPKKRREALVSIAHDPAATVLFESPHRLRDTLADLPQGDLSRHRAGAAHGFRDGLCARHR